MLNRVYLLPLLCATMIVSMPNVAGAKPRELSWGSLAAGGALGGLVGYGFAWLCSKGMDRQHQSKEQFLADLQTYISSDAYLNDSNNDRMFTHYYNGLNELVKISSETNVAYLQEFSMKHNPESQAKLLAKIKKLAQSMQTSHERGQLFTKILFTTLFALYGAAMSADSYDPYSRRTYVMPVFSSGGTSGTIFR